MMEFDKTNTGTLNRNVQKTAENPTWADYKGEINIDGVEYWLSAWLKPSKDGGKFMSISVKPKTSRADTPAPAPAPAQAPRTKPALGFDDDIPF